MKTLLCLATLAMMAPLAIAAHVEDCTPTGADAATYNVITDPTSGRVFYLEERGTGLPPVPMSGFFLADGTWLYEESNTLAGMQRGTAEGAGTIGIPLGLVTGDPEDDIPLTSSVDNIEDETCEHGPDTILF